MWSTIIIQILSFWAISCVLGFCLYSETLTLD